MWKTPPPPLQLHLELPGFRFHPTEEELLDFYLARAVHGGKLDLDVIATLDVYKYDPWDLPRMAKIGEKEWYFFVPRGRTKNGRMRPNRTTKKGFWKATGSDRVVWSANGPRRQLGLKKTLVYYQGRAPCGCKTDWIMSEYRLPHTGTDTSLPKENIVLCKVYRKAITQKEQEQRASVPRESAAKAERSLVPPTTTISSPPINCDDPGTGSMPEMDGAAERDVEEAKTEGKVSSPPPPAPLPWEALPQLEIEVPRQSLRWALEEACLWSPLMELWSPCSGMLKLHGDGT